MFSNRRIEKFDDAAPEFLQDLAQNPRVQQIKGKVRTATQNGKPVPKMKVYNIRDGIFEAMLHRFAIDPTMVPSARRTATGAAPSPSTAA